MIVYELTHIFFRHTDGLVYSPKKLGLYCSYNSVKEAVQYYRTQPGFCENQDAFSIRERNILGTVIDDIVYEALIYFHSEDYEFETEIELGLYGDEVSAQSKVTQYCRDNEPLINMQNIILENIVNKCILEKKEWPEGFSVSE